MIKTLARQALINQKKQTINSEAENLRYAFFQVVISCLFLLF